VPPQLPNPKSPVFRRTAPRCLYGQWEAGPQLGEGTYFRVFRARPSDTIGDDWDFALKTIRPEFKGDPHLVERLTRESEAGSSISSKHIVPVVDSRHGMFIVMPRVPGNTLAEILEQRPQIPLAVSVWIARQLAQGLAAMHDSGWIHGDVKPDNIIVSSTGHATLIDLGFAQRCDLRQPVSSRKYDRQGTLRYIPPEMLSTSALILPQADTYSLGVILHELVSGKQLFDQAESEEIVTAQMAHRPPRLSQVVDHVPHRLDQLVEAMLRKDPLRRPWPDAELVNALVATELELLLPGPKFQFQKAA